MDLIDGPPDAPGRSIARRAMLLTVPAVLGRHVGEDVARAAQGRGIELGGEELEVAVLFVDAIGSTQLAADRPPHEVVSRLNEFFGAVVEVVEACGGWINKFEGDAALAAFGAPLPLDDAAGCALRRATAACSRPNARSRARARRRRIAGGRASRSGCAGARRRPAPPLPHDPTDICRISYARRHAWNVRDD